MMAKRKNIKITKKNLPIIIIIAILVVIGGFLEGIGVLDNINKYAAPENSDVINIDESDIMMTAHFIDVGQGDCTLFIAENEAMLIDCGEAEYSGLVIDKLESYGVTKLTYIVATHAHSDHMGGMATIIDNIPTENIIISEPSESSMGTKTYGKFLDAADKSGADVILAKPDYTFSLGEAECRILSPFSVSDEENDNSVVMHITAGDTSFLMTGDAEKSIEKQIIKEYPSLRATILKVGHHGSNTSSHNAFISMLDCKSAVISVGKNNSYNHPTDKVLQTLVDNNIKYYRTDTSGTVTVYCLIDNSYVITTER